MSNCCLIWGFLFLFTGKGVFLKFVHSHWLRRANSTPTSLGRFPNGISLAWEMRCCNFLPRERFLCMDGQNTQEWSLPHSMFLWNLSCCSWKTRDLLLIPSSLTPPQLNNDQVLAGNFLHIPLYFRVFISSSSELWVCKNEPDWIDPSLFAGIFMMGLWFSATWWW